jgi:hypothetical protein
MKFPATVCIELDDGTHFTEEVDLIQFWSPAYQSIISGLSPPGCYSFKGVSGRLYHIRWDDWIASIPHRPTGSP